MRKSSRILCLFLALIFVIGIPMTGVLAEEFGAYSDIVPEDRSNYVPDAGEGDGTLAISSVSITASSAIILDYDTGEVYYTKNADEMRVPASLTKIMTAYIIYQELEKGNLTKDTPITVSATAAKMSRNNDYPMAVPLTQGAAYSVDTLLKLIMIPSASASCYAMAEHISGSEAAFVARMNDTAKELGLNANFANCHGAKVHYITARSIASLIRTFIQKYPDIINYTSMKSVTFNGTTYNNTNKLMSTYYYEGVDGFKTGTIPASGYCLSATAVQNGRRIITVVLNSTSTETRHTDSQKLLKYGFEQLNIRDAARNNTSLSVYAPSELRRNSDHTITIKLNSVAMEYAAIGGGWTFNGESAQTFGGFTASDGKTLSFKAYVPADYSGSTVTIGFYLNAAPGIRKEANLIISVSSQAPALYRDVNGHWAEGSIEDITDREVMTGYGDGYFGTEDSITRAQFVKVLSNMAKIYDIDTSAKGDSYYTDVEATKWYSEAICWATEQKLAEGYGTEFGPEDPVTREQIAVFIYRFMEKYELTLEPVVKRTFIDRDKISSWAEGSVLAIAAMELISGYPDGTFMPQNSASRAECARIMANYFEAEANQQEESEEESEGDDSEPQPPGQEDETP